jgi:glucan 1,3-beta-glucosidase
MSHNIEYDPLPLINEHGDIGSLSPSPSPSPAHDIDRSTPQLPPVSTSGDGSMTDLPLAGTQPRFLGAALNAEGIRSSYVSDHGTLQGSHAGSDYDGSFYALNKSGYRDNPRDSQAPGEIETGANNDVSIPSMNYSEEKQGAYPVTSRAGLAAWSTRRKLLAGLAALAVLIVVIAVPVSLTTHKHGNGKADDTTGPSSGNGGSNSNSTNGGSNPAPTKKLAVTGGDGSTVTTSSGATFTYNNPFGGTWYYDEEDPINNSAQCQSWTPPLNQTFQFGVDTIRGVNLGGWLVTEPFIVPSLYELYINSSSPAIDEWSLTTNLRADNNLSALEDHYKTFITEEDFAQIAGAGLNWVRIPIGYWAIETRGNEPFLAKVAWK